MVRPRLHGDHRRDGAAQGRDLDLGDRHDPACDAKTTRDTLSDLNKAQQFNASHYNSLKLRSASDAEALCTASLALRDGTSVEYDYRIYKDGSSVKVQITEIRRP